jgi:GH43 family beta-xylosidase
MKGKIMIAVIILAVTAGAVLLVNKWKEDEPTQMAELIRIEDIPIRDPFIMPHKKTGYYYMYARMGKKHFPDIPYEGVGVYRSRDLKLWEGPSLVFSIDEDFWAKRSIWAPEVHEYKGKFYLFATFTATDTLPDPRPVDNEKWPSLHKRATQILHSDSPGGPFLPFSNIPHTPVEWSSLDGTLYVEDGTPYMIFCHEWSQVIDGTMEIVELKDDLSEPVGEPVTLFRASEGEWVRNYIEGKVTDGPFFFNTKGGKLLMIWSSFGENGYAIAQAVSESGRVAGPWQQGELIFAEQGGHGMIFKDFNDELRLTFHQPNHGGLERAQIYSILEVNDRLVLGQKVLPE